MDLEMTYEIHGVDESFHGTVLESTPVKGSSELLDLSFTPIHHKDPVDENNNLEDVSYEVTVSTEQDFKHVCEICNYSSDYTQNVNRHMKVHYNENSNPPNIDNNPLTDGTKSCITKPKVVNNFTCDICSYTTDKKGNLKRHFKVHETTDPEEKVRNIPVYICEVCGKELHSKFGHTLHMKSQHEKVFRFTCPTCNKGFNQLYHYKGHLASHHDILSEKCKLCSSTFRYQRSLKDHIQSAHEGAKLKCLIAPCESVFSSHRALREHTRAEHARSRLECDKCEKFFKWRSSLKYHKSHAHQQK